MLGGGGVVELLPLFSANGIHGLQELILISSFGFHLVRRKDRIGSIGQMEVLTFFENAAKDS